MRGRGWLRRRFRANAARQWQRMHASVLRRPGPVSENLRDEARALQHVLSRFLQAADARALGPRDSLRRIDLPAGTDWRWRPQVMRSRTAAPALVAPGDGKWLSDEVALFHDCGERALILRQVRNRRATDLSDFGLSLEVMGFTGSFLSLSLSLPSDALEDLASHHILRLESVLQAERPIAVYARLNVQQGPNTETLLRKMGDDIAGRNCHRIIEFDLAYANLSQRSVDKAWLDVIFEAPYMNAVALRDAILSRHPRAQM
ncbi:DUF6478 family protein [Paracoccus beibuensis]|uniref:DUF6478 family protein n=1 Tax=Paracoccus beibuensis TaxID=547602 RepID=UPI00223FFAD2|nr:DUF6478 family protein [Paracoccus beibuensis]